jgi:hypothetical protein
MQALREMNAYREGYIGPCLRVLNKFQLNMEGMVMLKIFY